MSMDTEDVKLSVDIVKKFASAKISKDNVSQAEIYAYLQTQEIHSIDFSDDGQFLITCDDYSINL